MVKLIYLRFNCLLLLLLLIIKTLPLAYCYLKDKKKKICSFQTYVSNSTKINF